MRTDHAGCIFTSGGGDEMNRQELEIEIDMLEGNIIGCAITDDDLRAMKYAAVGKRIDRIYLYNHQRLHMGASWQGRGKR